MSFDRSSDNFPRKTRVSLFSPQVAVIGILVGGLLCSHLLFYPNSPSSLSSSEFVKDIKSKFDGIRGDNSRDSFHGTENGNGGGSDDDDDWLPNVIFGNYSMPITFAPKSSNDDEIQKAFDVALMECYGFAFFQARKIAKKLLRTQDDDLSSLARGNSQGHNSDKEDFYCPMCYWLLAMGHSPYINHPTIPNQSDFESANEAAGLAYAQAHQEDHPASSRLSTKEIGLIDAMQLRFSPPSSFQDQSIGYKYYENGLRDLHEQMQDETNGMGDADVMAFLADSIMIQHADADGYHFYHEKTLQPKKEIVYAITVLEDCLEISPDHPLCQHLYIHVTEPSWKMVAVSEGVADNLAASTVGTEAQHLQHMPSHSFVRIGRYHDAITANVAAHASDEHYENHGAVSYGVAHDLVVLIYAAGMSGEKSVALQYADILRDNYRTYPNRRDGPGTEMGWHVWRTVRLVFGDFSEILEDDDTIPGASGNNSVEGKSAEQTTWPYAIVLGHYSKGVASLWKADDSADTESRLSDAKQYLQKLREATPSVDPSFRGMISVADRSLEASISYYQTLKTTTKGERDDYRNNHETDPLGPILELIQSARAEQDSWSYTEPPLWHSSLKLCEGTLLRIMGRYQESIHIFKDDMNDRPENRYALYGLWKALKEKGASKTELKTYYHRFEKASSWADANVNENPPLICPELGE